ncbi:MAG: hypothetical protein R3202_14650, partial [Candidatus Competibacterales bacterium]|nr:hypothetical protein [Candidatus Competibacterales bacterium]
INHGQVFRFLPKPIKPGLFKLSVKSAMRRHLELMSNPDIAVRHKVEPVHDTPAANDDGPRKVAVEVEDLNQEERPSFLGRLFSIFRNKKNRKSLS